MPKPNKKILVIGPAWIGDMVMAQSLFRLLRDQHPEVLIHVLAPKATHLLLAFMPEVDKAILFETAHGKFDFWKRLQFGKSLRDEQYDQAILLTNSWKSALVPFFAKIPVRTGWLGEQRYILLNDIRRLDKAKYPLMYERFAALALPPESRLPALTYPHLSSSKTLPQKTKPILALCPGAEFGPAKRWPAEYYAELAKEKIKAGFEVWLIGSLKEKEAGDVIQAVTHEACQNFIGKTKLSEAIELLAQVDAVVCNDSGLMHIAAALDKPLVAIFGSSSPTHTPPLSDKAKILSLQLECSPCFQRECPLGHLKCLKELMPERVLKALEEFQ